MILITDLDGPILEGKIRHFTCYREILREFGYTPVQLETYWNLKRERQDLRTILSLSGAVDLYDTFRIRWLREIESDSLLRLDQLQPGARAALERWGDRGHRLVLATMRSNPASLARQLNRLRLTNAFAHIIVSDHGDGGLGKAAAVKRLAGPLDSDACVWIGDTEADIEASRCLGVRSIAVTCGLRTEAFLRSMKPDYLLHHLTQVDSATDLEL